MRNNNNDESCINFPENFRYDWVKKNGKPTDIAQVYTSDNKCVYQGPIKNRKPHGKEGKFFYDNGVLAYDGNWKDGKMDGKGKFFSVDGKICYDGNWENGKKNGKGKSFSVDGKICYDGNWENGKKNGKGKYFYNNGKICYDGNWKDGKMDGKGKSFSVDGGLCYDGNWEDGKKNGKGKSFYDNGGLCYDGNWKDDKKDGKGKYYDDGYLLYDGNWKDGEMDGMVNVYNQDGLIRTKEIWKEGKFQRLHSFENAPCISGVFINAGQRYELPYELPKDTEELYNAPDVDSQQDIQSEQDKKTFMNKKREREVGDGDLEIDNNSSQSSLKDPNKHDKKKGF